MWILLIYEFIIPDGRSGGNRNLHACAYAISGIIPDGRSGGNRNNRQAWAPNTVLYPMGDRGGTATALGAYPLNHNYTRWEIGGEPQPFDGTHTSTAIIPDGRSGGNRNSRYSRYQQILLYPMGDRGGTATFAVTERRTRLLYPMGDRGGTATRPTSLSPPSHYTRWEIGGEPQRALGKNPTVLHYTRWEIGGEPQLNVEVRATAGIIPDGRSGGNRN